jgi:hypothetical protein
LDAALGHHWEGLVRLFVEVVIPTRPARRMEELKPAVI